MRLASVLPLVAATALLATAVAAMREARPRVAAPADGARAAAGSGPIAGARVVPAGGGRTRAAADPLGRREFYFTRAAYSGNGRRSWGGAWATDYPKADHQFLTVLRRLVAIDAYELDHAMRLDDPELRRFPFLYAVEVGAMGLTPAERQGLRDYLLAGGFLVVDDFWGTREWESFAREIRAVLPEFDIVELPLDHPVFHSFYSIDAIVQVPNVWQGKAGGPTHERDGITPRCFGIFDDRGRLMVVINWNTDLGDAWEWAEQPDYPLKYSTFAYEMGANLVVYAMSH